MLHSLGLNWKASAIHTYAAGIRGSIISILFIVCKLLARFLNSTKPHFGLSLDSTQLYTASLLAFIQVLFPRRPDIFTPEGKLVDPERSASAFSRYSMRWCTTALSLAGKQVLLNELPALDYLTRSKANRHSSRHHLTLHYGIAFWSGAILDSSNNGLSCLCEQY